MAGKKSNSNCKLVWFETDQENKFAKQQVNFNGWVSGTIL